MNLRRGFSSLSAGFTLLEVVVAMTIVGIGVVTLLEIFSTGLSLGSRSSATTETMTYGRQAMDEILLRRTIEEGAQQGSLNERARWKLGIEPVREPSDTLSLSSAWELKEITLDMRMTDAGRDRPVELRTYRLVRKKNP
ncbi:MAG TPA: type II secretion system protein [Candidatus Binatia bacterium]|nr:type II secretion system protein [Candidatus Binatia bacterium]